LADGSRGHANQRPRVPSRIVETRNAECGLRNGIDRVLANAGPLPPAMKTVCQLDRQSAIRIPHSAFPRRHHYMRGGTLDAFVERLKPVPGIVAIVVGGSGARGTADTSSDTDLGLYYHRHSPLNVAALDAVATECDDRKSAGLVTAIGEWGPWINGGGWLQTLSLPSLGRLLSGFWIPESVKLGRYEHQLHLRGYLVWPTSPFFWFGLELSDDPRIRRKSVFCNAFYCSVDCVRKTRRERPACFLLALQYSRKYFARCLFYFSPRPGWNCQLTSKFRDLPAEFASDPAQSSPCQRT